MHIKQQQGLSLLELLITLVVLAIILSISLPGLQRIQQANALSSFSAELVNFIRFTRHQALARGKRITMCPLDESQNCTKVWAKQISVFEDLDGNRKLDPKDRLMKVLEIPDQIDLNWRGVGAGKSLHFNGRGITSISNGTFRLGVKKNEQRRHVIVSRLGKVKIKKVTQPTK
ncbi:GspH/FimT family pseudopilin [Pseudomonas segetis]|uniref:GspH/FimT family pseudopilin n=1 Tax=Pseudomonas segetis TaxID=298908 RepID=UPI000B771C87|nr:GspH/FimT family protein [Pseudomonas segetis]